MDILGKGQLMMLHIAKENFRRIFEDAVSYLGEFFIEGVETPFHLSTSEHGIIHTFFFFNAINYEFFSINTFSMFL